MSPRGKGKSEESIPAYLTDGRSKAELDYSDEDLVAFLSLHYAEKTIVPEGEKTAPVSSLKNVAEETEVNGDSVQNFQILSRKSKAAEDIEPPPEKTKRRRGRPSKAVKDRMGMREKAEKCAAEKAVLPEKTEPVSSLKNVAEETEVNDDSVQNFQTLSRKSKAAGDTEPPPEKTKRRRGRPSKADIARMDMREKLEKLQKELEDMYGEIAKHNVEIVELDKEMEELKMQRKKVHEEMSEMMSKKEAKSREIASLQLKFEE